MKEFFQKTIIFNSSGLQGKKMMLMDIIISIDHLQFSSDFWCQEYDLTIVSNDMSKGMSWLSCFFTKG